MNKTVSRLGSDQMANGRTSGRIASGQSVRLTEQVVPPSKVHGVRVIQRLDGAAEGDRAPRDELMLWYTEDRGYIESFDGKVRDECLNDH